ncbi:MAG: hypothetical protein WA747_13510 [Steroidobacteraceae bacterium]
MGCRAVAIAVGRCVLLSTLALGGALYAWSPQLAKNPIVTDVRHQSCDAAVRLIKPDVRDNDAPTAFLAGRMLDSRERRPADHLGSNGRAQRPDHRLLRQAASDRCRP